MAHDPRWTDDGSRLPGPSWWIEVSAVREPEPAPEAWARHTRTPQAPTLFTRLTTEPHTLVLALLVIAGAVLSIIL